MPKKAFLVGFAPLTRVVVDVPEDFNPEDASASCEVRDTIITAAREKILLQAAEKLDDDNCDRLEEDIECPYHPDYVWAVFANDGSRLYQYPASKAEDTAKKILAKACENHPEGKFHLEKVELY